MKLAFLPGKIRSRRGFGLFREGVMTPPILMTTLTSLYPSWVACFGLAAKPQRVEEGPQMTSTRPTESALITRCQAGDREAFAALYQEHKDRVYVVALRLCRGPNEAEDILQEVFLRVHKSIHHYKGDAAFSTWLYRLTVNATRSHMSQRATRPMPLASEEPIASKALAAPTGRDPLARRHLLWALGQLPEGYREVLVLHDIQGLKHREIAEVLEIQPGTSKSQLSKARREMRALLKEKQP